MTPVLIVPVTPGEIVDAEQGQVPASAAGLARRIEALPDARVRLTYSRVIVPPTKGRAAKIVETVALRYRLAHPPLRGWLTWVNGRADDGWIGVIDGRKTRSPTRFKYAQVKAMIKDLEA